MWHDFLVFVYNFDAFGDRGLSRPPPTHCYVTVWRPSICPSVSHRSTAVTADGGFAAKRRRLQQISLNRYRAAGAGAQQQMRVASCWQPTQTFYLFLMSKTRIVWYITWPQQTHGRLLSYILLKLIWCNLRVVDIRGSGACRRRCFGQWCELSVQTSTLACTPSLQSTTVHTAPTLCNSCSYTWTELKSIEIYSSTKDRVATYNARSTD